MTNALGTRRSAHAMSTYVDLDVHAKSTHATVIGRILKQMRIVNEDLVKLSSSSRSMLGRFESFR
jgi:hypothetical protein